MSERDASNPDELRLELEGLRAENRRLRSLLGLDTPERATAVPAPPHAWEPTLFPDPLASTDRVPVDGHSSPEAKVALFRSLFAGRDDVDAARWENERSGKSGWSPVVVGGPARSRRPVVRIHDPAAERRRGAPHRSDARRPVPAAAQRQMPAPRTGTNRDSRFLTLGASSESQSSSRTAFVARATAGSGSCRRRSVRSRDANPVVAASVKVSRLDTCPVRHSRLVRPGCGTVYLLDPGRTTRYRCGTVHFAKGRRTTGGDHERRSRAAQPGLDLRRSRAGDDRTEPHRRIAWAGCRGGHLGRHLVRGDAQLDRD